MLICLPWRRRTLAGMSAFLLPLLPLVLPALAGSTRTSGVIGKGSSWETAYYVQKSDQPGPTVVIVGGVHGDEPAGAAAAEEIRHWPITRGTLVVLPRANAPALAAHTRTMPKTDQQLSNLNRNFPKAGKPGSAAEESAQAIWEWIGSFEKTGAGSELGTHSLANTGSSEATVPLSSPLWLIDLHEGIGTRGSGSTSVGSSVIVQPSPEANAAVEQMLSAVNATIEEAPRKFVRLRVPADGSLARAAAEHLGARAMILETSVNAPSTPAAKTATLKKTATTPKKSTTTKVTAAKSGTAEEASTAAKRSSTAKPKSSTSAVKEQPLSRRIRQHRVMVHALLAHLEMISPTFNVDHPLVDRSEDPAKIRVALYDAGGTGGKGPAALDRLLGEAGMQVVHIGAEEIGAGALDGFNLVIFPGGSGSREAAAIGEKGRDEVRRFVQGGGGYIGVCAGAYLCASGFDWSLRIIDSRTVSPKWLRGEGTVKMELTPEGRKILGDRPGQLDVRYANGPIIKQAEVEELPDFQVLAWFRTELAKHGSPAGVMVNSPAIAAAPCGKGRVVSISPHPEQTPGLEDVVRRAALWAVGRL